MAGQQVGGGEVLVLVQQNSIRVQYLVEDVLVQL